MSVIEVKNVSKLISNKTIIDNISFRIEEGSIVGLLGPNGSGKTTMIRLLNGVIGATQGEITVFGKNIEHEGENIRKQAGVVTETTHLYHEVSALDNLRFFASLYGVDDENRIEELLKEFEMWEHRFEPVGSFSTGMKKRVALCKALLNQPKILFLDEPTNGIDPEGILFVLNYLKKLREREKVTIIICTHVLQQLEGFCDSFLFLSHGKIIEQGKKEEIEKRHLKEYQVEVIAGLSEKTFKGYRFEKVQENKYLFYLTNKNEISTLLKDLLEVTWVEEVKVLNNNLDTLYFTVGGESVHE